MPEIVTSLISLSHIPLEMVEDVLDRAFGEGRHARTAYRIRQGTQWLPALSFAALDEDEHLVGTIQVWPVALTGTGGDGKSRAHPLLMVGPVAVLPERQDMGYGRALMAAMAAAIEQIATDGGGDGGPALPQVLIGDPGYYRRFGFDAKHTSGWRAPGPYEQHRLLARAANPAILPKEGMLGSWHGSVSGRGPLASSGASGIA